jgi:hypothetical protein
MKRLTVIAVALTAASLEAHNPNRITPPPVPAGIEVPAGNKAFLVGHAYGTQNYICLPSGTAFVWSLFTPQATLFNDDDQQIITHYFSPNPDEGAVVRATWQHSRDTSTVWALGIVSSSDANFVAPGAIPWVRLQQVGVEDGPTGGDKLSVTTWIQRLNTVGGIAPATGCAQATDVGRKAFMPYTADYFFYKKADRDDDR